MPNYKTDLDSPYRWGAPAKGFYGDIVIDVTGCQPEEVAGVIQLMRDKFRTLDGLSRAEFRREARAALRALHQLWTMET